MEESSIGQFLHLLSVGLIMLLPLTNPLTSMSLLLALGGGLSHFERTRQVRQGAIYVMAIMLVTYYGGSYIMTAFAISLPGMRIAGGLIVAYIGFKMLFPSQPLPSPPDSTQAVEAMQSKVMPNLAFVPLAMPGTAGPGTMAMIMSAAAHAKTVENLYPLWMLWSVPVFVALFFGLLFYVGLMSAEKIVAVIGQGGVDAISRVMGFLLICMAVQFVIDGALEVVQMAMVPKTT